MKWLVLIGSNGAGKSNFVSFFRLLRRVYRRVSLCRQLAVLRACCSRDISASIAAIKSDVFIGAFDLEWHILGLGCVRRPYVV